MNKLITFFIASMHGGGAERIRMYMANELFRRNWKVTLLLCSLQGENLLLINPEVKVINLKFNSTFLYINPWPII